MKCGIHHKLATQVLSKSVTLALRESGKEEVSVYSHIEAIQFLLAQGFQYVLPERFMQDVVEDYFGNQKFLLPIFLMTYERKTLDWVILSGHCYGKNEFQCGS